MLRLTLSGSQHFLLWDQTEHSSRNSLNLSEHTLPTSVKVLDRPSLSGRPPATSFPMDHHHIVIISSSYCSYCHHIVIISSSYCSYCHHISISQYHNLKYWAFLILQSTITKELGIISQGIRIVLLTYPGSMNRLARLHPCCPPLTIFCIDYKEWYLAVWGDILFESMVGCLEDGPKWWSILVLQLRVQTRSCSILMDPG